MERICPYLALATDHRTVVDGVDPDHRCHAITPAGELDRSYQATICLTEAHRECERFVAARHRAAAAAPAVPRPAPDAFVSRTRLILAADGGRRRVGGGDPLARGRRRRWALAAGGGILGVALVGSVAAGGIDAVFGGGRASPTSGATQSGAGATPSSTPSPSAGATATSNPPTPSASPLPTATTVTPAPTAAPTPAPQTYVVVQGDTLSSIAARFGTTVAAIQAANGLADGDVINIGQVLIIP